MNHLPRAVTGLLAFAITTSCSRDLQLPPFPAPGSLTGRVTYAQPGTSDKRAAGGAAVGVVGSGLQTQTNPSGVFSLAWGDATDGLLMIRFDADGDGSVDRQRVVQLAEYNVGPNKHVDLGDVLLGENASVRGRVLRADVATHSGHSGSTIFLPEGPFAATTGDDGSFFLNDLPAGPVALVAFRPGYEAHALGTIELRSGEQFTLADVVLQPAPSQPPGGLSGKLLFVPTAVGVGDTRVTLEAPSLAPRAGTVDDSLNFHFDAVAPGLYSLRATRSGYTPLVVPNVLVPAGGAADLGTVEVTDAPIPDAGQPALTDGGSADGGPPCTSGSCAACVLNAQCASTEYCDYGHCTTQCTTANDCSLGRSCDPLTRTCVLACTSGFCAGGQGCETSDGGPSLCRTTCDGTFPCGPGFTCDVHGLCVPQCRVATDCPSGLPVCHAGQCEPASGCADDRQCAVSQVCFQGGCVSRPTARVDGGAFACSSACDCRLGEWCHQGLCLPEAVPTAFFAAGASGTGRSMASPSGDLAGLLNDAGTGERFALRARDSFFSPTAFTIGPGKDGLALRGGYTVCNASRWVRDDLGRSALETDGGPVVVMGDANRATRVAGAEISNLALLHGATSTSSSCRGPVEVINVDGPVVERLDVTLDDAQCGESPAASVWVDTSAAVSVSDVKLLVVNDLVTAVKVVDLTGSFGEVRGVTVVPNAQPMVGLTLVGLSGVNGTTWVHDCVLPPVTAATDVTGIGVRSCTLGSSVLVERNRLSWPLSSASPQLINGYRFLGLAASTCGDVTIGDNLIDGSGVVGNVPAGSAPVSSAVLLVNSAGVVQRNVVRLPSPANAAPFVGVVCDTSAGLTTISDNVVTGGVSGVAVSGLSFVQSVAGAQAGGPIMVARNQLDIGASPQSIALYATAVPLAAGLTVRDNLLRATGTLSCATRQDAYGVYVASTSGLFERNRIYASGGTTVNAFYSEPNPVTGSLELYANHLWAGPAVCAGGSSVALGLTTTQNTPVALMENTLDAEGDALTGNTIGLACEGTPVLARGNLIGGGRGLSHAALSSRVATAGLPCFGPANFEQNLFWLPPDGGAVAANDLALWYLVDGGTNQLTQGVSPYDAVQPASGDGGSSPPSRLAANSAAVDRGVWPLRADGSPVLLDLDGRPRDGGAGPDIGCCER